LPGEAGTRERAIVRATDYGAFRIVAAVEPAFARARAGFTFGRTVAVRVVAGVDVHARAKTITFLADVAEGPLSTWISECNVRAGLANAVADLGRVAGSVGPCDSALEPIRPDSVSRAARRGARTELGDVTVTL
jgi:hypothetical protein